MGNLFDKFIELSLFDIIAIVIVIIDAINHISSIIRSIKYTRLNN